MTPRVLFVIPGSGPSDGSSMVFARRQAEILTKLGIHVETFYLRSRTSPLALWGEWKRFRRAIRASRPAVVHAHFGTVTAAFAALAAGTLPLIVTYRGGDLNPARGARPFAGRVLSQLASLRAARIVCVSQRLSDLLWWRKHNVTILASGVDPDVFRPRSRTDSRRALGWHENARIVLFNAGRDWRNKRLDLATAAVETARLALPDLRFEVLNGGVDPDLLPLLMSAADCLLVTSDAEGSPTVIQEALATNLPIVTVDVGDVAERLAGVRHTRIVERDERALAEALVEVLAQPGRSDGRRKVHEFASRRIALELCRLYREAAGEA